MRKLIIVSITINTLLLAGVVALAVRTGSITKGDTGASATEEQLIQAADKVKPTAEKLAEKVAPYVNDAKGFAENSSKSAAKAEADVKVLTGEIKKAQDEIKKSEINAKNAASDAENAKKAAEIAKKSSEEAEQGAKRAIEAAIKELKKAEAAVVTPERIAQMTIPAMVPGNMCKTNLAGTYETIKDKKVKLKIAIASTDDIKKLILYKGQTRLVPRTKVVLVTYENGEYHIICECKDPAFAHDHVDVEVDFFKDLKSIVKSQTIYVMFGKPDPAPWTYAKIAISEQK